MSYVLGVDAGNTKTIALVATLAGMIVGSGRGGCGDIYCAKTPKPALSAVAGAATAALEAAGVPATALVAGGFSMAGADWPEDFALLRAELAHRALGRKLVIVNDAIGALRAGALEGTGVSVVCGTGIATGARAADGRIWHTSFWQEAGGSRELGRKTLRTVYRAELGIEPPTALTGRVLDFFKLPHVEEMLRQFTMRGATMPATIGGLARVLLDTAEGGDPTARRIVQEHGANLGDYALVAARRVGIEHTPFALVLAGGVLRHPTRLLTDSIVARVHQAAPGARPLPGRFEPAVGALFLAFEAAGVPIDDRLLASLIPSLPPATFFAT